MSSEEAADARPLLLVVGPISFDVFMNIFAILALWRAVVR
jgi:hypothetical protein